MAAAQIVGTPVAAPVKAPATAAPATPAAPAASEPEAKGLTDLLDELPEPKVTDEEAAEASEGEDETPATEGEKPAPKTEEPAAGDDDERALEPDEKLLTDEALSTPEGVKRAAEVMRAAAKAFRARSASLDRYSMRIDKRAKTTAAERETVKADRAALEREVAPAKAAASRAVECFRVLDPHSGASTRDRLAAIGVLVAGDPRRGQEIYEEWSLGIAADGKVQRAPVDRETQARIDRLERQRLADEERDREGKTAAERTQMEAAVKQRQTEIVEAAKDAETYPVLAGRLEEDPEVETEIADYATALMVDYHKRTGRTLGKEKALAIIEGRLSKAVGGRAERAGNTGDGSGTPTKTPNSPARSAGKGKTVLPSSADRSTGIVREPKTPEERLAMNAKDPEFMDALFGSRWRSDNE